jgi:hypothetical protein
MKLTLQEHIEKVRRVANELARADAPVRLAAGSAIARFSERVFLNGQTVSGGKYQYNDSNPLYVNPSKTSGNTSGLKPPTGKPYGGKPGRKKFKSTGLPHKTTWVESYKALKEKTGRESSFVNFTGEGDLKSEIENRSLIKINEANYKMAVTSEENTGKLEGLIDQYPGVFQLSATEKQAYYNAFDKEFLKMVKEKLK